MLLKECPLFENGKLNSVRVKSAANVYCDVLLKAQSVKYEKLRTNEEIVLYFKVRAFFSLSRHFSFIFKSIERITIVSQSFKIEASQNEEVVVIALKFFLKRYSFISLNDRFFIVDIDKSLTFFLLTAAARKGFSTFVFHGRNDGFAV